MTAGPRPAERVALACVLALLALLAFRQVGSLDTGFHLRAGEHILAGKGWPATDPFTFTLGDRPYVDTSWGYQVLAAAIHRAAGTAGLVGLDVLLVLATFLLLLRTCRLAPADPGVVAALLLAGGLASELRFEARPELGSWLLLAAVLHLLHRRAEGLRAPLWALPILHLVWANLHALFVLGWGAIACFLVAETIRDRRVPRDLLGWGALSVAVTVINPYGLTGALFPLTLATRLQEGNAFAQSIGEFVSPFALRLSSSFPFYPRLPVWCFRALFVLAAIGGVLSLGRGEGASGRRRPEALLLFLAFAPLSFRMIRNMPILVIATLPATAFALARRLPLRGSRRAVLAGLVAGAAALLSVRVATDAYYVASRRMDRFGIGWNGLTVPVDAARFADRVGLRGPMLNHLDFGGYLMWARPDPVFIDGRLEVVGEEFYRSYRRNLASEGALEEAVARYALGWIVFPYPTNPELLRRLSDDRRWRLAHFDHLAAIFVRERPGAGGFVDPSLAASPSPPGAGPPIAALPGLGGPPRRSNLATWVGGLVSRERFPVDPFYRGLFHYFRGEFKPAERRFAEAIRDSDGAYFELYHNLGSALWQQRRFAEAAACYRIVLEHQPDSPIARQRAAGGAGTR